MLTSSPSTSFSFSVTTIVHAPSAFLREMALEKGDTLRMDLMSSLPGTGLAYTCAKQLDTTSFSYGGMVNV